LRVGPEKALFDGNGNVLGKTDADETAGGDGVAIANQAHGLGGADDFAALAGELLGISE
jgi:hypothetical protein